MAGSSMAGSSNSTQQYVLCKHKLGAVLRTIKKGKNIGQRFYGCPLWPQNGCNFFLLENDTGHSLCNRRKEGGTSFEKKVAEEKILKLKMKNKILKKEVTELKNEANLLKLAMFGLVLCFVFAITYIVRK